ncbi:MAG: hypothetical protein M0023_04460 [Desulfobacteraceae bacterium]|nr:hypothetical protein [Desulfobacteraceae bacterium]
MALIPPTPVTSPTDIETAIEAWLVAQIAAFKTAKRQQNMRFIFTDPAVTVAVFDGKLVPAGRISFRVTCPVHVELAMTNAKSEEARRDGINPLVFGVIQVLSRQRFGLAITDLFPKGFKDVTSEEDFKNNRIVYDLEFETSFYIEIAPDATETALLTIGLSYFLQPDDGVADATDTINFAP